MRKVRCGKSLFAKEKKMTLHIVHLIAPFQMNLGYLQGHVHNASLFKRVSRWS